MSPEEVVSAEMGLSDVRLIVAGDVVQEPDAVIVADDLGVRQEGFVVVAGDGDLDSNGRFDVVLDEANDADVLAIANVFDGGIVAFNNVDNLTIGDVSELTIENVSFVATQGLSSTLTEPSLEGDFDTDSGDILVQVNGAIQIENSITAGANPEEVVVSGNADLRLIADGSVAQSEPGIIRANEFGVRLAGSNDIQSVLLDQDNDVSIFSAEDNSDGGFVVINDTDDDPSSNRGLTIGTIFAQAIGNLTFDQSSGIATIHSGAVIEGVDDNNLGDVLVNSSGFLQLSAQVSAGEGNSDFRITAFGDVQQEQNAPITANEFGVYQSAVAFSEDGEVEIDGQHSIDVGPQSDGASINNVDIVALFNQESQGDLIYRDVDQVTIDSVFAQTIDDASFIGINGIVSDDGTNDISGDGTGDIIISAATSLDDGDGVSIVTLGNVALRGDDRVELADQIDDQIIVGGNALIQSASIAVGQDGDNSVGGSGNVLLGTLTVNDLDAANSSADITEDDDTVLSNSTLFASVDNRSGLLILTSGGSITNDVGTEMSFDQVQFNAVSGNVFIGNQNEDSFSSLNNPEIEIGVNATNVSIAADSSVQINGLSPLVDNASSDLDLTDNFGTSVSETLFLDSEGHITQLIGSLDAAQIGLQAAEHVQLELVSAGNDVLAVRAGDAIVSENLPSHQNVLDQLQSIAGSEVNSQLIKSISIAHD